MEHFILAAFLNREDADKAISELRDVGYDTGEISVIARQDGLSHRAHEERHESAGSRAARGAGSGATAGAIIGGLAGLLAGAAGILILGPIAALLGLGGVLGSTVTGLVIGAAVGGLAGALIRLGVPSETAERYEKVVHAGGLIIGVPVRDIAESQIRDILVRNRAEDITEIRVSERTRV